MLWNAGLTLWLLNLYVPTQARGVWGILLQNKNYTYIIIGGGGYSLPPASLLLTPVHVELSLNTE